VTGRATSANGYAIEVLAAKLCAFETLMNERDRRYEERDKANKEAVRSALAAAEKAAEKTESALKEYKIGSNEWRDTVKDLVGRMPSRVETDRQFNSLEDDIVSLRETRSETTGATNQTAKLVGFAFLGVALLQVALKFWG